ncbi:4-hydroxybenzoate transporter PcaK-like [Drosophila willistoni]|uniref:4-hydroxybenzoate transporter PcaK-like n=1 Tax=Drosophila willistoni TaxID=7260 RepID=UPI001F07288F|nr:4-hydroxybenzoate transporter PcaK-like [Drosophila willistoni]
MDNLDTEDDLDTALTAAGFGCFNVIMGCICLPVAMAIIFCTSIFSYAMTTMECELSLTNAERGTLNGMAYFGMIAGAIFWALISDNLGRRPVIIFSHIGDAIFGNILALSQNFPTMCVCKFFSGLCICGGYSSFLTYLAEVHSSTKRTRMMFLCGVMLNIAAGILPIMAIIILPSDFKLGNDKFSYASWQLFLTLGTLPSIIVAIVFGFMPESPKFDIHHGKNARAINTLKKIQFLNGKRGQDLPDITIHKEEKARFDFKGMIKAVKKQHLFALGYLIVIEVCILMCQNTIRLWQPTFVKIAQTQKENVTFCAVIEEVNKPKPPPTTMAPNMTDINSEPVCKSNVKASTYHGNLYIFMLCFDGFIVAMLVAGHYDVNKMLVSMTIISSLITCCLVFAKSYLGLLTVLGLYLCVEYVSAMAVNNLAVQYFPTIVRTTFLSLIQFSGRFGSFLGNQLLPQLMGLGCYYLIGWLIASDIATVVATLLLPNPQKRRVVAS